MTKVLVVLRWEISKLFGNWRKTVTVFLLPAILMMIALNLFPALMNYMTTGSFSQSPIIAVNAPDSFKEFTEARSRELPYDFNFKDGKLSDDEEIELIRHGHMIINFSDAFDEHIIDYYKELLKHLDDPKANIKSYTTIDLVYDEQSYTGKSKAAAVEKYILKEYKDYLLDTMSGDYRVIGMDRFVTNDFNPITLMTLNRSNANDAASRLVPGIMGILLYYCVYSLSCDMFATEKDRGFFRKLLMTPISPRMLVAGKTLAITVISSAAAYTMLVLLFFTSWLNRSNDAMSLLPFGMLLGGKEILCFIIIIPPLVFCMVGLCVSIIFSLEKLPDILMNLQMPLIFFLILFFMQMIRIAPPFSIEFMIPIYGGLCGITDIFGANIRVFPIIFSILANIGIGSLLLHKTCKKIEA